MSIGAKITIEDLAGIVPRIKLLDEKLGGDRRGIHEAIGRRALNLTRGHLTVIAQTRHDTAERLGATPSGHWAQAAEKTDFEQDQNGVTVTIRQPGISRVAGDVTIKPKRKKFLTIPAIAAAYNQRAYRVPGLFVLKGKMGGLYLAEESEDRKKLTIWYRLLKSVKQKQDRSLLPSDEEYSLAGLNGVRDFVQYLLSRQGGAEPTA